MAAIPHLRWRDAMREPRRFHLIAFRFSVRGMTTYADYKPLTFHDAARRFTDGNDSPRAYLDRCRKPSRRASPL